MIFFKQTPFFPIEFLCNAGDYKSIMQHFTEPWEHISNTPVVEIVLLKLYIQPQTFIFLSANAHQKVAET